MSEQENKDSRMEEYSAFGDLLSDAPISSLNISEPEMTEFDVDSAAAFAKSLAAQPEKGHVHFSRRTRRQSQSLIQNNPQPETTVPAPKSFKELLNTDFLTTQPASAQETIEPGAIVEQSAGFEEDQPDQPEENIPVLSRKDTPKAIAALQQSRQESDRKRKEEKARKKAQAAEEREKRRQEEEERGAVYDQKASLVDDYHYDEYEDKKGFLLSDYKKIEEYLAAQSAQGYHYTRHEGKKYYFVKGRPHQYYYEILYYAKQPTEQEWDEIQEDGWRLMFNAPSRLRKDDGWFIVRNEKEEGELAKTIDNEEEKMRYFRKFASSCRSTMFLLFIVMAASAVSAWLQYEFKGFPWAIALSAVLFVIAFIMFLMYARMRAKARKQANLMAARLRLQQENPDYQKLHSPSLSDEQLEDEWNALENEGEKDPLLEKHVKQAQKDHDRRLSKEQKKAARAQANADEAPAADLTVKDAKAEDSAKDAPAKDDGAPEEAKPQEEPEKPYTLTDSGEEVVVSESLFVFEDEPETEDNSSENKTE